MFTVNMKWITNLTLKEPDSVKRAELMLNEADKLKAREFITANDVIQGNEKLNKAYELI
jgi:hypothetical protein